GGRNTALVAPGIDAAHDAFENSSRRQERLCSFLIPEKFLGIVRVRNTKSVRVGNGFGTEPKAETIAVDANDCSYRAPVWVESRRRIMRLDFMRNEILIVKR